MFGWCADGFHADGREFKYGTPCPGVVKHKNGTERKCNCWCHTSDKQPTGDVEK